MNLDVFLNALAAYFVVMDPLGVSLIFNGLTGDKNPLYCRKEAVRAVVLSSFVVLGFGFFGAPFLDRLGITMEAFRIAGGLLLFHTAFSMAVRPDASTADDKYKPSNDLAVFPLTFPLIAGPGCLTLTVLLFSKASQTEGGVLATTFAIVTVLSLMLIALLLSRRIASAIGATANAIVKRLLGVLLAALAVQFIVNGVMGLMKTSKIAMIGVVITLGASMATGAILSVGVGQTYSTIAEAYAAAAGGNATNPGDTIEIHEGVYTAFNLSANSGKNYLTFQRHGDDKVIVRCTGTNNDRFLYLRFIDNTTFKGLIFDATDQPYGASLRSGCNNTTFRDCIFIGATVAGLYVYGNEGGVPVTGLTAQNCTFINCAKGYRQNSTVNGQNIVSSLFVNVITAIETTSSFPLTVEYSAFWNCTTVRTDGTLGSGCLTTVMPIFSSKNIQDPDFMHLSSESSLLITEGGRAATVMGARSVLPSKTTLMIWQASPAVDVCQDMTTLGIFHQNAPSDGSIDTTSIVQAAINYLSTHGGGTVLVPTGLYRIQSLNVVDGVRLAGDGPDKTIFRSRTTNLAMVSMSGGSLANCTLYGTDEAGSGPNWVVGTNGVGAGGTARPTSCVRVDGGAQSVLISNIHASEARYDPLYVGTCQGLRVLNCRFDRAGRNIVTLAGNTDDFVFSNCYFGSLWGLYHFDMEPNEGKFVRNGRLTNCEFDGSRAGEMNTGTWGSFFGFCMQTALPLASRNITVKNCRFNKIWVRILNVFPEAKLIDNHFDLAAGLRTFNTGSPDKFGEFRDAVVRGNTFPSGKYIVSSLVTFTGNTVVEDNLPPSANTAIVVTP